MSTTTERVSMYRPHLNMALATRHVTAMLHPDITKRTSTQYARALRWIEATIAHPLTGYASHEEAERFFAMRDKCKAMLDAYIDAEIATRTYDSPAKDATSAVAQPKETPAKKTRKRVEAVAA